MIPLSVINVICSIVWSLMELKLVNDADFLIRIQCSLQEISNKHNIDSMFRLIHGNGGKTDIQTFCALQ